MKDCNNGDIRQGDVVVVAQRCGSSIWLRRYKVSEYKNDKPILTPSDGKTRSFAYTGRTEAIMIIY